MKKIEEKYSPLLFDISNEEKMEELLEMVEKEFKSINFFPPYLPFCEWDVQHYVEKAYNLKKFKELPECVRKSWNTARDIQKEKSRKKLRDF